MVIAIDLDGVVFDTEEYFRTYAHLYDIKHIKNGLVNSKEMDVHVRLGWNNDVANEFYGKYTKKILENAPVKPGVRYVIDELKRQGHTIISITARGVYRECETSITIKRLKKEKIKFDNIVFGQEDKLKACIENKVDVMIDDKHSVVEHLGKNNIKCLHFRAAGLKMVKNENVISVQNWGDVLEKLNIMQN